VSKETIEREFEAYRKDEAEIRAIYEADEVTPEDDERAEKLMASADAHKKRADKLVQMDADASAFEERMRALQGDPVPDGDGGEPEEDKTDPFVRNFMEHVGELRDKQLRINKTYLAAPNLEEVRAIANFSDSGSLYTTTFVNQIAVYERTMSPWLGLANVINSSDGRPMNIPRLTVDPTGYTPGEGTAITESSGTIGSAAISTTSYKALSYFSAEATQDELVAWQPQIAKAQARQLSQDFGSAFTAVVLAGATNGGTASGVGGNGTATITFIGYEDLLDLKYSLAAPYRNDPVAAWVMSNGLIVKARKFKTSYGEYLWQSAMSAGQPPTFDGNAVFEDPYLAAPGSATKPVVFGDIVSAMTIHQTPMRVATSTEFLFNTDQVAIKTVHRLGGAVVLADASAYLVCANT
jgi:HK97 family phage major capsid protein